MDVAETPAGAEGTTSEEAPLPDEEEEREEGEEEEEVVSPGTGPRKVMLIDGAHPEEIRVAIVSDGVLDYFEVVITSYSIHYTKLYERSGKFISRRSRRMD